MKLACYRYDKKFHAFVGVILVAPQQYADGRLVYELPPNSTLVEAPFVDEGEAAVFLDKTETWLIVSDHRGETWHDWAGRAEVIDRLGNPKEWGLKPLKENAA